MRALVCGGREFGDRDMPVSGSCQRDVLDGAETHHPPLAVQAVSVVPAWCAVGPMIRISPSPS